MIRAATHGEISNADRQAVIRLLQIDGRHWRSIDWRAYGITACGSTFWGLILNSSQGLIGKSLAAAVALQLRDEYGFVTGLGQMSEAELLALEFPRSIAQWPHPFLLGARFPLKRTAQAPAQRIST